MLQMKRWSRISLIRCWEAFSRGRLSLSSLLAKGWGKDTLWPGQTTLWTNQWISRASTQNLNLCRIYLWAQNILYKSQLVLLNNLTGPKFLVRRSQKGLRWRLIVAARWALVSRCLRLSKERETNRKTFSPKTVLTKIYLRLGRMSTTHLLSPIRFTLLKNLKNLSWSIRTANNFSL